LCITLCELEENKEAIEGFKKTLEERRKVYGEKHVLFAGTL
jgi:hypothetical protein